MNYNYLLGKNRSEILNEFGMSLSNFFESDLLIYNLKSSWWEKQKFLCIEFKDDHVKRVTVRKY